MIATTVKEDRLKGFLYEGNGIKAKAVIVIDFQRVT